MSSRPFGSSASTLSRPSLLRVEEVAGLLRTTRKAVYALIERGQLPGVTRVGRRVLIREESLLDWLEACRALSPEKGFRR